MHYFRSPPSTVSHSSLHTDSTPGSPTGPLQNILHLIIHLSLRFPGKGAPPCSPQGPFGERYSVTRGTGLSIHRMSARIPQKGALLQNGEKHTVTVHETPLRRKAYIQRGAAWFPKGIVNDTAISSPVPCSPRHDTFRLGLDRPQPG
jgi:hypothetical protein